MDADSGLRRGKRGILHFFGGTFGDSLAAFAAGICLYLYVLWLSVPHLSKIVGNIGGGALVTVVCCLLYLMGVGENLNFMMIGTIMPLVPGVAFTNSIRDVADGDYISGSVRMLDALLVFFCIAIGVGIGFSLISLVPGSGTLQEMGQLAEGSGSGAMGDIEMFGQLAKEILSAVVGTGKLFRNCSAFPGSIILTAVSLEAQDGWSTVWQSFFLPGSGPCFLATAVVILLSRTAAVVKHCPVTYLSDCRHFPLVPGAGVYWTVYHIVMEELFLAVSTGYSAMKELLPLSWGLCLCLNFRKSCLCGWPAGLDPAISRKEIDEKQEISHFF